MHEQGTLVAPRLVDEEGVGKSKTENFNEHDAIC